MERVYIPALDKTGTVINTFMDKGRLGVWVKLDNESITVPAFRYADCISLVEYETRLKTQVGRITIEW